MIDVFADDIKLICELTGCSHQELSAQIGVSRMTINRWMKGTSTPSPKHIASLHEYAFKKGIHLNEIKSQLLKEEANAHGRIALFHGSKSGINGNISIDQSRNNNDFGAGFYCGESFEQAGTFVCAFPSSRIYALLFNPHGLNMKQYFVNTEWMLAIAYHRGLLADYKNHPIIESIKNAVSNADYIVAPIADNRIFRLIDEFAQGLITDVQCEHALSATSLGNQYVFKTEKAIKNLRIEGVQQISNAERSRYDAARQERSRIGQDKAKVAKRPYRNEGLYVEELLT